MAYIYHYHAVAHLGNERKIDLDGIVSARLPVDSQQHYDELKQQLAKHHGVPDVDIRALSFLHETEDA